MKKELKDRLQIDRLQIVIAFLALIVASLALYISIPPEERPKDITLEETKRNVYLSEFLVLEYLDKTNYIDKLESLESPKKLSYDKQKIILKINPESGSKRRIKIFLTDSNNIIRYADSLSAKCIEENLNNESSFKGNSYEIDNFKINIIFDFTETHAEEIGRRDDGTWILNIIVLNDEGQTTLFVTKAIEFEDTKLKDKWL